MVTEPYTAEISIFRQLQRIKRLPGFTARMNGHSCLVAEGDITPNALAETYRVRVDYRQNKKPRTWVLSPHLVVRPPWKSIPHMFDQERLCLFLEGEWTADMYIADTIIPWAAQWLHYYELWHATGEWLGGGHEPSHDRPYRRHHQELIALGQSRECGSAVPHPGPRRRGHHGNLHRRRACRVRADDG